MRISVFESSRLSGTINCANRQSHNRYCCSGQDSAKGIRLGVNGGSTQEARYTGVVPGYRRHGTPRRYVLRNLLPAVRQTERPRAKARGRFV